MRVLVTGASGFIGGRLVERLVLDAGAQVRVLVRERVGAAPLARFPIEVAVGDVLDADSLGAAVADCDVVFNCATGKSRLAKERRAVDVKGTENLFGAATRAGARRAVHISTVMVYDIPEDGVVNESTRRTRARDAYASAKLEAERVALGFAARGELGVSVIQPTIVYGPNAGVYGRDVLDELRKTRMPLVDGGRGTCNAVFVDDVVTALLLAAVTDAATGEAFLVSGPEPVTWREFFGAFEKMLGVSHTFDVSLGEALDTARRASRRPWLVPETIRALREDGVLRRRLLATREGALALAAAQRFLPVSFWYSTDPWFVPPPPTRADGLPTGTIRPFVARFLASRARISCEKAQRVLGYEPQFGLDAGMRLTEPWARWAGLLDSLP